MRLLIANEVDPMLSWVDWRTYSQRLLWFAADGDALVLPGLPGDDFLRHVCALTAVDPASLSFHVPPPGRYAGKVIDPYSLLDDSFAADLENALGKSPTAVEEILSFWPSPVLPLLAERLGLRHLVPGADFMAQNGGELANSKATFRALAAGAGVPMVPGAVCHSSYEAEHALQGLLGNTGAVLVKQAHNGAGAGNELVIQDDSLRTDHAEAKFLHQLAPGPEGIRAYLNERWDWASQGRRYAVVIEEFRPDSRTVYIEFLADDTGVRLSGSGTIVFEKRRPVRESVPLRGVPGPARAELECAALRLAAVYQAIGYRGYMSTDAVMDQSGRFFFTEMNARVTGSLHIYGPIAGRVADAARSPVRSVTQHSSSPD